MDYQRKQYGVHGEYDERTPTWPWFVVLCLVLIVLGSLFLGLRKLGRRIRDARQPAAIETQQDEVRQQVRDTTAAAQQPREQRAAFSHAAREAPVASSAARHAADPVAEPGLTDSLQGQIAAAEHASRSKLYAEARRRWLAILADPLLPAGIHAGAEAKLTEASVALLTTAAPMPGKKEYTIQRGDVLTRIARQFGMTQEWLIRLNQLPDAAKIVAGHTLWVIDNPRLSLRIDRTAESITLLLDNQFVKRWPAWAGTGDLTPAGRFEIGARTERPSWWLADGTEVAHGKPGNMLGTRWLGLRSTNKNQSLGYFGIHGTTGYVADAARGSNRNIRMRNADIEELFIFLRPGTPVTIE